MSEPVAGDRFDQYELLELLARSGMAAIFKARDTFTGATVALKIPHFQYESDIVFSERFRREEEVGQKLEHPNIVRILKPREKSRSYLAMEYIEGRSLRALMGKAPMAPERALALARQVCAALAYLEERGVVHRDIKPENILVTADGTVKIIDFGIALFQAERRMTWAGLSQTVGTPDYMAPEQIRGRRGDARTDVYALGMLLYELLSGHLPYDSPNARALMRAKTSEEPKPPSYWVPGFDPHLEAIILRAIEREPRNRYAGAAEMCVDLGDPGEVPPRDPETGERRRRAGAARRRRRVALLAVAALVAGLLVLVYVQGRSAGQAGRPTGVERGR
ncbi:MAG TPA: serine/threonine-protein kinase [Anaeromyxobacter sp.]|nr:serine/threonine-protein kinase [Anaeromyxobacter sp.]